MKITLEILSLPPYISTTWENISSLSLSTKGELSIQLKGVDKTIDVPGLNKTTLNEIFEMHAKVLQVKKPMTDFHFPLLHLPLKNDGGIEEPFLTSMQHNPEQANIPLLPPPLLQKITAMAEMLGLDILGALPNAEPGCHCIFCQVMSAFHQKIDHCEEEVTADDLTFKDWEVKQTATQLYDVTNPLDTNENYHVFLGDPIGCTCGQKNCEHIRAVLKT